MPNASELQRVEEEGHASLAREIHKDWANLILLLSEARTMLAGASVYVSAYIKERQRQGVKASDLPHVIDLDNRINKFIAAGFFGDK